MILKNLRREVHHEENRENNHVCRCIYLCDRSVRTRFRRSDIQRSASDHHDRYSYSTRRIRFNLFGRLHFRHKKIAPIYALPSRCDS
nr:MAG TPA: hypothetical protein [Caudoviricetes sp.]